MSAALNKGTTVRLPDSLRDRIDRVAAASGFRPSDLIRRAVEEYCSQVERSGVITVPIGLAETPVQYGAKGKKKPGNSSTE